MKRVITCCSIVVGLFLAVGCDRKESKEPAPVPPSVQEAPSPSAAKPTDVKVQAETGAKDVRAVTQYTLTYRTGGNGSIDGDSTQVVAPGGSGSEVRAVPAAGYHFIKWSDGSTANPRIDAKVTADLAVTATFAVNQYTLLYSAGEHGSITGASQQTVNHGSSGKPVTAAPETGYHFVDWSDGSTANPRTDVSVTADLAVTASFTVNQYTLNYTAGDNGSITGASPQTVNHGSAGSVVTAVPAAGYHFVSWSDGVATPDRIDADVRGDITVSASFEINTYTVGGKVAGLAEGNEVVLKNNEEDLAVRANGEFVFPSVLTDGRPYAVTVKTQPTSPNQTCTVSGGVGTIAGANVTSIKVECKYNVYTVGGTISGLPDGNQIVLRNNKADDLVVSANGKFVFAKGLDDGSPYGVTIHSQQLKPKWFCSLEKAAGSLAGGNITSVDIACFPEAELLAVPGLGKIDLSWNSKDFRNVTFNLCRAREDIDKAGFGKCTTLADGVIATKVKSPLTISRLVNDVPYWLQLEVQHPGGRRTYSEVVTATPFGGINDTGIDWCADSNNRNRDGVRAEKLAGCEASAAILPGQDAHSGRDAAARLNKLPKSGSGSSGFDFSKVCGNGKMAGEGDCPPNPTLGSGPANWACVRDNVTGLFWEVKTTSGLQSQGNLYSWYNPDAAVNGGAPGAQNGGRCEGSRCDTHAYVQEVNKQGLCGANDWRLPSRKELHSIVDNGQHKPAIDTSYFPNTPATHFWTATPYADQTGLAWQINFQYGEAITAEKSEGSQVRLVRRPK